MNYLLATFFVIFLSGPFGFAEMQANRSMAKMRAPENVSSDETITFLKNQKKLTPDKTDILKLALLARDVFAVKDFEVNSNTNKAQSVGLPSITNSIALAIQNQKSDWDQKLSATDLTKINQDDSLLKKSFGENSYTWAWITYQKGEKTEAKAILVRQFDRYYNDTMKLTQINGFRSESPLRQGEVLSKALTPMSDEAENKSREEILKKIRTYISSLPDMQMMT